MKKWMYLIPPTIMLGLFMIVYFSHVEKTHAKEKAKADLIAKEKDKLSRETFDLAKQVELARIARRNAELEIQRVTEMIHRRASDSALVKPPVIPPAPAKS